MLWKFSSWMIRISKTWVMLLALAVMILFMLFVLPGKAASSQAATGSDGSPDTTFFYQPNQLSGWAEEFGSGGRQAYIYDRWTFDLIFPLVYVAFLATGISWFHGKLTSTKPWISLANMLPISAGMLDYLENICTSLFMGVYPSEIPGLAFLAAVFSALKWIILSAAFLAYFALAATVIYQKLRPNRS